MLELAIGDRVAVSKRGDVIPAIERVIEKNECGQKTWRLPRHCPECSTSLTQIGSHHFCRNSDCPAQVRGRLHFFCARGQMDIESLGPETLDFLLDKGLIKDVADIYDFDFRRLQGYRGFGDKKIGLIRKGVEKSKTQPFAIVLQSLGIPEVGQRATELLLDAGYTDIKALLELADCADPTPLEAVHGIGAKIACVLTSELAKPEMRVRIDRLRAAGLAFSAGEQVPRGTVFANQIWCATGSFERFRPREQALEEVKKRGGRVVASVSAQTTHLLVGSGPGSKLQKAKALGVNIVDEREFLTLLGFN